ncbi:MAG: glycosyltransferase family 39 protein [Candidatus Aenigmarchaeota archaeon]|nr:glycosyltransferase family 39 protein [Candidatus Aenigmarchaeota archaeon]
MKAKKYWYVIILIAIFLMAFWFRTFPARFGELQALDPFYIYRMSEYIVNNNLQLPELDIMRLHPFGTKPYFVEFPTPSYLPVILYLFISFTGVPFFSFALIYPAFMGAIAVLAMFFVGKEFFDKKAGLFAAFFLAFIPGFITRTTAGFFEKEPVSGFFMLISAYFFILAFKRKSLKFGIIGGLSLAVMGSSWGGTQFIYLIFTIFAFAMLILNKYHKKLLVSYVPVVLIGILLPQVFPHSISLSSPSILLSFLVIVMLILRIFVERFKLISKEKLPFVIPAFIVIGFVGFLIATMFLDSMYEILQEAASLIFATQRTPVGLTVAENQPGNFDVVMQMTGASGSSALLPQLNALSQYFTAGIFMLLGIVVMAFKLLKKINPVIIFSLIWLIGSVWSVFYAVRLIFLVGPPAALIAGFFLSWLIKKSYKIKIIENKKYIENIFLGAGMLFLILILIDPTFNMFYIITLVSISATLLIIYYMLKSSEEESIIKTLHDHITGKIDRIGIIWIPIIIIIMLTIAINLASGFAYSNSIGPSICFTGNLAPGEKCITLDKDGNQIMNLERQPWYQAFNFLATETPEDSNIVSWWDFGYWFQTRGKRNTVADGGQGDRYTLANWFTSSSESWEEWEEWLIEKHGVDYILMDYTLPAKYGAITSIATGGKNIVGIAQFQNTGTYPQENKTVVEFSSGPYKIWIPFENESIAGSPMFLYTQNGQVVSRTHLKHLCTKQGIIELEEKSPIMPGCVALTDFGVFYIPEEAEKTIFSAVMFMEGHGLPLEKVFDNTLVKIYKVN